MRFDLGDFLTQILYVILFGTLLIIFGLDLKQSISMGLILTVFYLALVKIHNKLRR